MHLDADVELHYALTEDRLFGERVCQFLKLLCGLSSWKLCLPTGHWKVAGTLMCVAMSCQRLLGMIQCTGHTEHMPVRTWCCLSGIRCHWIWLMWEPYKWLWKQTLKEYLVQFIDTQSISSLLTIYLKMEKDTAEICRSYIIFFALLIWEKKKLSGCDAILFCRNRAVVQQKHNNFLFDLCHCYYSEGEGAKEYEVSSCLKIIAFNHLLKCWNSKWCWKIMIKKNVKCTMGNNSKKLLTVLSRKLVTPT